ncbi:hypothetical protein PINS_up013726 [Pythium insidiosum]|nr:hypothetical protein PINS_up013726 [Pythium insidiosum]
MHVVSDRPTTSSQLPTLSPRGRRSGAPHKLLADALIDFITTGKKTGGRVRLTRPTEGGSMDRFESPLHSATRMERSIHPCVNWVGRMRDGRHQSLQKLMSDGHLNKTTCNK